MMLVFVGSLVFDHKKPLNLASPVFLIILLSILKIRLLVALTFWIIFGFVGRSCLVALVKTLTRTILKRGESIAVIRALT